MLQMFTSAGRALALMLPLASLLSACGASPTSAELEAPAAPGTLTQSVGSPLPLVCPQDRPVPCEIQCDRSNCARCCTARQRCQATCVNNTSAHCLCTN